MNPHQELKRYWRGPTAADRVEMLEAIGECGRFHHLTEEQKESIFSVMFSLRFYMDTMRRVADGRKAITLKRGPSTIELALQHLVERRYSAPMAEVLMRLPNPLLNESSSQFFDFAQAMVDACRLNVSNTELAYDAPSAKETWAPAQLEEAERLRSALAAADIRSYELIGKMCRYTSGKTVGEDAIKKRFANVKSASQVSVLL